MIEKPEPPQLPAKPKPPGLSVVGAGCLGMGLVLGLAVLVMAALGGGTALGLILFGVIAFSSIAVHYIVWGWWLGPRLLAQAEREAEGHTRENIVPAENIVPTTTERGRYDRLEE